MQHHGASLRAGRWLRRTRPVPIEKLNTGRSSPKGPVGQPWLERPDGKVAGFCLKPDWKGMAEFYVYILRSLKSGRLYIGHTSDLQRRLAEHNEGRGGQFTRQNGPWQLRYSEVHMDRTSAVKRELFLKSVEGSQEKKRLAHHGA